MKFCILFVDVWHKAFMAIDINKIM